LCALLLAAGASLPLVSTANVIAGTGSPTGTTGLGYTDTTNSSDWLGYVYPNTGPIPTNQ
jgi:hypothetical protein